MDRLHHPRASDRDRTTATLGEMGYDSTHVRAAFVDGKFHDFFVVPDVRRLKLVTLIPTTELRTLLAKSPSAVGMIH